MVTRTYITIDGDDIGRKITACYIENNETKLSELSRSMAESVQKIASFLQDEGFRIAFSAADGIAGCRDSGEIDLYAIHRSIQSLAPEGVTFSAGTGATMRDAYLALLYAKSSGKNTIISLSSSPQMQATER